jgi:hypothetical protein
VAVAQLAAWRFMTVMDRVYLNEEWNFAARRPMSVSTPQCAPSTPSIEILLSP